MRYMTCRDIPSIPQDLAEEAIDLNTYILQNTDYFLSVYDTYRLWTYISMNLGKSWVPIDYHPTGIPRLDYLKHCIEYYCEEFEFR